VLALVIIFLNDPKLMQWGYFEVGLYNGAPKEREEVIHDFRLGRLDVGAY
jgi:hypothetical protein